MRKINATSLLTTFGLLLVAITCAGSTTLYWIQSDSSNPMLIQANGAGTIQKTLMLPAGSHPQAVVFNPDTKTLFWTELMELNAHIRTAKADLSDSGSLLLEYMDYKAPSGQPKRADMIFRLLSLQSFLTGITIDQAFQKIYWTTTNQSIGQGIFRSNIDGSLAEMLVSFDMSSTNSPRAIAIHEKSQTMYWANFAAGSIQRAAATPLAQPQTIVTGLKGPVGIALDQDSGMVFWSDAIANTIGKASLDGSSAITIVKNLNQPDYLSIDLRNRRLYWSEIGTLEIRSSNLDGSDVTTLQKTASAPSGITIVEDSLSPSQGTVAASTLPQPYEISVISPNPLMKVSLIQYRLSERVRVNISLFDVQSRRVRVLVDEMQNSGRYRSDLNVSDLAPGLYYYRLAFGQYTAIRKAAMVR
jgi:hypothetical protein